MLGLSGLLVLVAAWGAVYGFLSVLHRQGILRRDWHRDILSVGVLLAVTLAFYWPLFFTKSWIPKGGGDLSSFVYPIYAFAARWLKRGIVPLWNPHLYMGMPFAADNQSGLFYPINLAFFLLTPDLTYEAVELMAVLHVFLAGVLTFAFLRDLASFRIASIRYSNTEIKRIPAIAGAVAYMLSDLFVVHPGNLNIIATATWLPLAMLCFRRALARRSWGWAAASGIVLGIAALVGHAQMLLYVGMALALYAVFEMGRHYAKGWGAVLERLGYLLFAGLVAFGLAALALIPAYDMTRYTVRSSMSYTEASEFAIPPAGLVSILVPGFFGRGTGPFWGPWSRTEMGYVGVLPLLLAVVSVVLTWRRRPITRFCCLLGVFGLLTAMGPYAALHGWTYALVPFFRQLRVPARAILLFDFSIAILAGGGLDLLLCPLPRRARRVLASLTKGGLWIGGAVALIGVPLLGHAVLTSRVSVPADVLSQHVTSMGGVVFFLVMFGAGVGGLVLRRHGLMHPTVLGALVVVTIAFDLISLGAYVEIEPNDPLVGYRHDQALAFLRADPDTYRVETTSDVHGSWAPDWALVHEMDDLGGIWNPLRLGAYDVLTWVGIGRDSPLYRAYNVKYLITGRDALAPPGFDAVFDDGTQMIYRNARALPRAFMVYQVLLADSDINALSLAKSPDFDPSTQIVLKREGSVKPLGDVPDGSEQRVAILERGPNHIDLEVFTPVQGYLFLSEMWMPGWVARIDGEKTDVLQANYTFRAVHIPEGTHRVHMVYRPLPWRWGLGISVTTVLGLVVWAVWSRVRHPPA